MCTSRWKSMCVCTCSCMWICVWICILVCLFLWAYTCIYASMGLNVLCVQGYTYVGRCEYWNKRLMPAVFLYCFPETGSLPELWRSLILLGWQVIESLVLSVSASPALNFKYSSSGQLFFHTGAEDEIHLRSSQFTSTDWATSQLLISFSFWNEIQHF